MQLARRIKTVFTRPRHVLRTALQEILFNYKFSAGLTRLGGVALMARLTALAIDVDRPRKNAPGILVLDRLYFSKDIDELRQRGKFNYALLHTHILSVTQANWLPEELQEQISYAPRTRPHHGASWHTATSYAEKILEIAHHRHGVDAVLASNVDYWQHESFRHACKKMNIPFLVLCQELQTLKGIYDLSLKLYRDADFHYDGDGVAVFGEMTGDMLVESDCCTRHQIHVTGAPRLDPWYTGELKTPDANAFTLLAYDGDQYFAPQNYIEALKVFATASHDHKASGFEFVLKCKDAEDEARSRCHLAGIEHNLVIGHDQYLPDLFSRSRAVMGYNSLAIIEALLSPAELAVPQWGDAVLGSDMQIIDPANEAIRRHYNFLESPQDWRDFIDRAVGSNRPAFDKEQRQQLVASWFYVPADGNASAATEKFIQEYIDRQHQSSKVDHVAS